MGISGFGAQGAGFRVGDSGYRFKGSRIKGFGAQGAGFRVVGDSGSKFKGLGIEGFGAQGAEFRVGDSGYRFKGLEDSGSRFEGLGILGLGSRVWGLRDLGLRVQSLWYII